MSIFPLDAVRNAPIDHRIEPVLEDLRGDIASFPFSGDDGPGMVEDVLEAYDLARPRLNVVASLLQDVDTGMGADIGTGLGFLPVLLQRLGIDTVATEKDPAFTRFAAAQGIEIRRYCIGRTIPPFEPASLDFAVLAEVLEHLKQPPVAVLREITPLLRSGGRLILTTPNVARMQHLETLLAGENFLEPFPEDTPPGADPTDLLEHIREYSVREVVDAVEAAGLAVERVLMTGWGDAGYAPLPNPYVNDIIVLLAIW